MHKSLRPTIRLIHKFKFSGMVTDSVFSLQKQLYSWAVPSTFHQTLDSRSPPPHTVSSFRSGVFISSAHPPDLFSPFSPNDRFPKNVVSASSSSTNLLSIFSPFAAAEIRSTPPSRRFTGPRVRVRFHDRSVDETAKPPSSAFVIQSAEKYEDTWRDFKPRRQGSRSMKQ